MDVPWSEEHCAVRRSRAAYGTPSGRRREPIASGTRFRERKCLLGGLHNVTLTGVLRLLRSIWETQCHLF